MADTVGKSYRTPAKHSLMWKLAGQEVGATRYMPQVDDLLWLDLTAGDGVGVDELAWEHSCSPGIAAAHARNSPKPITVILHEIKAATFDRLERNIAQHLPKLGYRLEDGWWECANARLSLTHASGSTADVSGVSGRTAVLVTNDPNSITDWAMRPTFAAEIRARTRWFRSISTMGCNTAGLKRLDYAERLNWFDLIQQQRAGLPNHHDLLLAAIERDAAQWAYLLSNPVAGKWREKTQGMVDRAFGQHGMTMESAWLRLYPSQFSDIQHRLFLTKKELSA